jgi:hypothetical protein
LPGAECGMAVRKKIRKKGKKERKIKSTDMWAYCGIFYFTISV